MTEALRLHDNKTSDVSPDAAQRAASEPNSSVWVNASAGTGKTTVLTKRVTRLLLDGVSPQRILCLTYTRAAAAEMALRVTDKLSYWATCDDNELSRDIGDLQGVPASSYQMKEARKLFARMLGCPGGMRIRTIHAFCQEILRRFPIEAGLPPHFAVIEESDARSLQEEALKDVLNAASENPGSQLHQALEALASDLGEQGFTGSMQSILSDRARLQSAATKAGGLDKLIMRMRSELSLAPDETSHKIIRDALAGLNEVDLRKAGGWLAEASKMYMPRGAKLLAWLGFPLDERAEKFDAFLRCFFNSDGDCYDKIANKELLAKYPDLETIMRAEATRLERVQERLEAAGVAEITTSLLTLGMEAARQYEKRKASQAALDYDDLIIRTDALLRRPGIAPWVLYKLDGGLDHILVDEAQDTSRAQWNIVASLADEFFAGMGTKPQDNRTLFVVGDEKQSIFSFQRADPEAFEERRNYFTKKITDADKIFREVPMRVSFRSAPAILKAVDQVFESEVTRTGVSAETVKHMAFWQNKIGRVEIWPLIPAPPKDKSEEDEWALPLDYEKEHDQEAELAKLIANKIKADLAKEQSLPGQSDILSAGDIMILLRRRGRFADLMVRALKERDVPVTGVDRMRLIQQLPVMDLLALVQFSLLPEDNLNLACALKGPLLGLNDDHLMALSIGRKGSLWSNLTDKVGDNKIFAEAHGYLSRWLNIADFMTPFDFLAQLLHENCPSSTISGMHAIWSRLGPDALDPVNELLNAAQNFSQRHTPSLQSFIQWLSATEVEIKRELDRGGGQVRIMTVHAAKGLEAPVVYLPDAASLPRAGDLPKILWHGDTAFYIARKPRAGIGRRLWDIAREKQMEEYRRLLYVALTRAANELYVGGWAPARNEGNPSESWYGLVAEGLKSKHQPEAVRDAVPQPSVVIADYEVGAAKKTKTIPRKMPVAVKLPSWIGKQAPLEEKMVRSLAPSRFVLAPSAATPDAAFARGRIIHRLLQSLPDVLDARRDAIAARFLANPEYRLTAEQQKEIQDEVLGLLRNSNYALLFGADSRAEVPLVGHIEGQDFAGQVDRLCVRNGEVLIVDYKTNRPPPENTADIPEAYRLQMAAYRAILKNIYPDKKVRCFLLWTYKPLLMEVPEA